MTSRRPPLWRTSRIVSCRVRVRHDEGSLFAEVDLDDECDLGPGDRVRVLGEPVQVGFGEGLELRREAVVQRAGLLGRYMTRLMARFQFAELYEVSFTPGRLS